MTSLERYIVYGGLLLSLLIGGAAIHEWVIVPRHDQALIELTRQADKMAGMLAEIEARKVVAEKLQAQFDAGVDFERKKASADRLDEIDTDRIVNEIRKDAANAKCKFDAATAAVINSGGMH